MDGRVVGGTAVVDGLVVGGTAVVGATSVVVDECTGAGVSLMCFMS